ncbi:putative resolvase [uncultured Caudovirales phage]|uniref:Putative resolvase n=1 Tax=uncultured Caudovirales phage TaxID=2100421 RepID=A0A2H4J068_9CAUD|nr:putative resolvase [uncultured Caudovirales phage]
MKKMKIKIAIYVRVSTHHQVDKDSLPLQRSDLINYCKFIIGSNDYEIFEDAGYSGKNTSRPKYQEMMNRIKEGEFSHLLVWKIDRISRNLLDFCDMYENLKKYNCTFISKNEQFDTSSAMGEAMLKIILVFAELERKLTAERVKAIMLDRASKGMWNGAPIPLGYSWDETIKFPVPDPNESKTVDFIFNQYKKVKSTSIVRNILNSNGIKTKKGGTWTTKTITDIIRNPFYIGTYRYNFREPARGKKKDESEWIVLENNHEGIISKELWQECNDIMDRNASRSNAQFRDNTKTHIFSRLLECGECHGSLTAKQDKPHLDGYIPSIYCCSSRYNNLGCNQKTVSEKIIGNFTFNLISEIIKSSKNESISNEYELEKALLKNESLKNVIAIDGTYELYNNIFNDNDNFKIKKEEESISFEVEGLKKEKEKYKRALERLENLYLFDDESMSKKDYLIKKNRLKDKLIEIGYKLSSYKINTNDDINFIKLAANAILNDTLAKDENIDIKNFITEVGRDVIKEFTNAIISKITTKDKRVTSIKFKNGINLNFIYNT